MKKVKAPDSIEPLFDVAEFLSWEQIASFWSANAKNIRQSAVDPGAQLLDLVDDDQYYQDINIGPTEDDIIDDIVEAALVDL